MSTTVDNRVVEMRFDNKQFEQNVSTTMSTLEKLKQSLSFTGIAKGFDNISSAARGVNLTTLGGAVDTVGLRFRAMYSIADQALRNITNSAVNAGKQLVSSFTVEPVKTGLSEYETQIGAIQTILANTKNKGSTLEDVNGALDELNTYADKTIYNFTEMTRNIGTFTAAGVDLDKSVTSIKGIANLAAVSGSTSQQASTAMYQLSQALASGTVKLMDWNSVVNAGMGGQVFQDALKRTATHMGTNVDALIKKYGSFRESLSQGNWLTAEVLTETLTQLSGAYTKADLIAQGYTEEQAKQIVELADTAVSAATEVKTFTQLMDTLKESAQSGWTQTWEILIGDFEQAKALWTGVSNTLGSIINASAESRNKLLQGWADAGGRDMAIEGIKNAFEGLMGILTPMKEAFRDVFPPTTSAQLIELTKKFKELTETFKLSESQTVVLRSTFRSLFKSVKNILDGIVSVLKPIKEVFQEAFSDIVPSITLKDVLEFANKFEELTSKFKLSDAQAENLKSTFRGLFAAVDIGVEFIKSVVAAIGRLIGNMEGLGGGILEVTGSWGEWLSGLRDTVKETDIIGAGVNKVASFLQLVIDKLKIFGSFLKDKLKAPGFEAFLNIMQSIWGVIQKIGSKIAEVGSMIGNALANAFRSGDISAGLDIINGGLLTGLILGVKKFFGSLTDITDSAGGFLDGVKGILDGVKGSLEAWQRDVQANTLLKIAGAIGILALSLTVLAFLNPAKLAAALSAITVLFADLMGALAVFNKLSGGVKNAGSAIASLIGISVAVLILAGSLRMIANLGLSGMAIGLTGIIVLTEVITNAAKKMESDGKKVIKGAGQMIIMAIALKVLASVCEDLSALSWDGLAKGLIGVGLLLAEVNWFLNNTNFGGGKAVATAFGIVVLSVALKILASACADLSSIDFISLAGGLVGIGILLVEVNWFLNNTNIGGKAIVTAFGVGVLAVALKILASACVDLGSISFTNLAGGLVGVALLLAEVNWFLNNTNIGGKGVITAFGVVIIAGAIKILASAVQDFASLSLPELAKGLVGLAVALAAITAAIRFMPKNVLGIGVSVVAIAAALVVVAEAVSKFGGLTLGELAKGLIAMALSLGILAVGLTAMNGTLIGSAALLVAAGALTVLSIVLTSLSNLTWGDIARSLISLAGAIAIMGVAGLLLYPVTPVLVAFSASVALFGVACVALGAGVAMVAAGLSILATMTAASATAIVASLSIIITGLLGLIPVIVERIGEALILLCEVIIAAAPALAEAIIAVVLAVMDLLVTCVPVIVEGLLQILLSVWTSLAEYTPQIVTQVFQFIIGILESIAANLPSLIQAAVDVVMAFFSGVVEALRGIDVSVLLQGLAGVGILGGLMVVLAGMAALAPAAMIGVLAMGAVIAELALMIAALGAFAQIPGLEWFIGEGATILAQIGGAIGSFIGGIVGSMLEGITASLPQMATDLSMFMVNLTPFIVGASMIDQSIVDSVKSIAAVLLILTGASILEGLTSWITGGSSMADFGSQLVAFGNAMVTFSQTVAGNVNEEAVTAAANAGKIMADMAATLPNSGGVVGFFTGENDMGTFAAQLVPFGQALVSFSSIVSGNVNAEAVMAAANAGKMMAEMASTLPNSGGVVGFFTGENDMATFAAQLEPFGSAIAAFSKTVSGKIDEEAVMAAANAGKMMAEMADTLPNSGGVVGWFMGENDMDTFGAQLVPFGEAMVAFSESVSGKIDEGAVTAASSAGKALAEMADTLPNSGGVVGWFMGENDMDTFGTQLTAFGSAMVDFSKEVEGISVSNITVAKTAVDKLVPMLQSISTTSFTGTTGFSAALNEVSKTSIDNFVAAFEGADTKLENAGINMAGSLADGLKSGKTKVVESAKSILTGITDSVTNNHSNFRSSGTKIMKEFGSGVSEAAKSVSKSFTNTLSGIIETINGYYTKFYNAGKYVVTGFANGIDAQTWKAEAKARAMANAAEQAAKEALDEHSPSRVFYDIGAFAGIALVNALGDYEDKAYKAGFGVAEYAKDGLSSAISKVRDAIDGDIDSQPTIRPVLDLSEVEAGAGTIGGMFGLHPSVGVLSNINAIGSMMGNRQNGANSDVISAIKDLGRRIGNSTGNTYNVNGVTYDDGSNVSEAVRSLVRAARIERRT